MFCDLIKPYLIPAIDNNGEFHVLARELSQGHCTILHCRYNHNQPCWSRCSQFTAWSYKIGINGDCKTVHRVSACDRVHEVDISKINDQPYYIGGLFNAPQSS